MLESQSNRSLHLRGASRAELRSGGRTVSYAVTTGAVSICGAGYEIDYASWRGAPTEILCIELQPSTLRSAVDDEFRLIRGIKTELLSADGRVKQLLQLIKQEFDGGCVGGRLYAEGLSLSLLGYLATVGGQARVDGSRVTHPLAAASLARIRDYVHEHLAEGISIASLSELVGLSPSRFTKVFKESTGQTPYSLVQEIRIARSRELLASRMSISDVASAVGFATQAHFTHAFRQQTGTTPAKARR